MILLSALMTSSPSFADWELVPTGWTAQRPGYWGEIEDGRDTLAALRTAREEAAAWEKAFYASEDRREKFEAHFNSRLDDLEASMNAREKAHKQEVRKAKAPGLGIFAGGAIDDRGEFHPVVGFGLVWRF